VGVPHFAFSRSPSPSTPELRFAAPANDEDDEDDSENGYVPYVWEEDSEGCQDDVVHLHGGDEDNTSGDNSEGYWN